MSEAFWTFLPERGVVEVGGPDAGRFLQNLITADVADVVRDRSGYGALLTPQGKILFDFLMFPDNGRFLLDLPQDMAADLARRLSFFRLRAAVEIADRSGDLKVAAAWGDRPPTLPGVSARDPRHPLLGTRALLAAGERPSGEPADPADYDTLRIALGIPKGGADFAYGETFPHEADLDQLGGVDFAKGCFVGQEVVSRMEHRGTARRRIIKVNGASPLPAPGTEIVAGAAALGTLGSVNGSAGLAAIRLDRAREAIDAGTPITADAVALSLAIPDWARFAWPAPGPANP